MLKRWITELRGRRPGAIQRRRPGLDRQGAGTVWQVQMVTRRTEDERAFDHLFPLYFSQDTPPAPTIEQLSPEQQRLLTEALQATDQSTAKVLDILLTGHSPGQQPGRVKPSCGWAIDPALTPSPRSFQTLPNNYPFLRLCVWLRL